MALGIGVMIDYLGGNDETVASYHRSVGKVIAAAHINDNDQLDITFEDGTHILAFDDGQSCCESRYMRTDDDLSSLIGGNLIKLELRDAPNEPDDYGAHEVQFLIVETSKGSATFANHNEHNGYYGGFNLVLRTDENAMPST